MARQQSRSAKKISTSKSTARKTTPKPAPARGKSAKVGTARAKPARGARVQRGTTKKTRLAPLPRPLVTGNEQLCMLFKDDYHARQVFEFLRVQTVQELETFTPRQIFERLTQPVQDCVLRIRRRLADKQRCLAEDETYLREALAEAQALRKAELKAAKAAGGITRAESSLHA